MEPIGTVRWGARAAAMMGMPMLVWPMMVRSSPSSAAGCGAIVIGCGAAAIGAAAKGVAVGMLVIGVAVATGNIAVATGIVAVATGIGAAVAVAIGIAWA